MLPDLFRALNFAAKRHSEQRRKGAGAEPYVNHLVEVGFLLSDVGKVQDSDTLIAAILHDIIEDTPTTLIEIDELFGPRVMQLVGALTDDKLLPKAERKQLVLAHLITADESVKLIKLVDLCSNINSIPQEWSPDRLHEYLNWTRQVASLCAGVSPTLDELFLSRWLTAKNTQEFRIGQS